MQRRIIDLPHERNHHDHVCPECGGGVNRIPRTTLQRLMVVVFPAKRYQCSDRRCGWEGMIRSRQYEKQRRRFLEEITSSLFENYFAGIAVLTLLLLAGAGLLWWLTR